MEFRLNEPKPGVFEIAQFVPETVGTFSNRAVAEKVMGFLEADALNAARMAEIAPVVPAKTVEPDTSAQEPQNKTADKAEGATVSASETPRKDPQGSRTSDSKIWADTELKEAFQRLKNGEKLQVVADDFGKSWTVLRSKWAAHKQYHSDAAGGLVPVKEPAQHHGDMVTTTVKQMSEQRSCSICGTYFTPALDDLDCCARCSHSTQP